MFDARIALTLSLCTLTACLESKFIPNPDYCGQHDGDAYCGRVAPETPYCVLSSESCYDQYGLDVAGFGCVAEAPVLECRQECGIDNGDGCLETVGEESSSTGGETEDSSTTMEPETDTEDPSTTTGPECSETTPCLDETAPFCVDGECSPCSAVVDVTPDEACTTLDEALPLCIDDACVQCTTESFEACGGTTPLCDGDTNTCVGCSFHEECEDIGLHACNIATGACFSADAADVSEVNAGTPGALQAAVDGVTAGAEHTIIVTGSAGVSHNITVDAGKSIAIVSASDDPAVTQNVAGLSGAPTLTVTGAGTTVYLHRLALTLNGDDVGISVGPAGTLYADSTRVAQNTGGGISLATGSFGFIRNCMVAGAGGDPGLPAVAAASADVELLFSTLGLAFNNGGPVLECSGGSVSVRNSIVASDTSMAGTAIQCPGAMVVTSRVESDASADSWFGDIASADFSLTAAGQTEFANIAVWEDGDPPFDFEGDDRPATDGAMDYPGADEP